MLGEPVEIVISDKESSNETAQAQLERLINGNDVDVLFGTFSSRLTFPPHLDRGAEPDGLPGPFRRRPADLRARLQVHLQLRAERRGVRCGKAVSA